MQYRIQHSAGYGNNEGQHSVQYRIQCRIQDKTKYRTIAEQNTVQYTAHSIACNRIWLKNALQHTAQKIEQGAVLNITLKL